MRIAVFGLGYVGCVSAASFAELGHSVIGVDVNPVKVEMINSGKSPIIEKSVDKMISESVRNGRLRAVELAELAVAESDLSLICVGTPSQASGGLDLNFIKNVTCQIGEALAGKNQYHVVAVRSTVMPGTIQNTVIPILEEKSNRKSGEDFGVCSNPEFLREGCAVHDFYNPPFTLIGELDERAGECLASIYGKVEAPILRVDLRTAEMVKYACNAYHALKIGFANEIGIFCKAMGVDSHRVMDVFKQDTKLNISPAYLQPGFAFGGSCLPKDVRALLYQARHEDLELPLLRALMTSNEIQVKRGVDMVLKTGKRRIGILGLSFKAGTDDLRESPMVSLVETLIGKGYNLKIHDPEVSLAKLMGANKEYIERTIPHISSLLSTSLEEVLDFSDVLVVGNYSPAYANILNTENHIIIDLVRMSKELSGLKSNYQGICW